MIEAVEALTIYIVGNTDKHYKVKVINCDKMWYGYSEYKKIDGNLWIRMPIMDRDQMYGGVINAQVGILIERIT